MRRRSRVNYKHGQVYHIMEWLNDLWENFSYLDCKRSVFVPAKILLWKFLRSSFVGFLALYSHMRRLVWFILHGFFPSHHVLAFCHLLLFGPISIWSSLYFMSCFSRQYLLNRFFGFSFYMLFCENSESLLFYDILLIWEYVGSFFFYLSSFLSLSF